MKPPTAFEVLGVTREAAPEEIRRAYRRIALRYHPDRNPDDPDAERKFKELVVSYEKIRNLPALPEHGVRRKRYGPAHRPRPGRNHLLNFPKRPKQN